jgi:hypothetical protein
MHSKQQQIEILFHMLKKNNNMYKNLTCEMSKMQFIFFLPPNEEFDPKINRVLPLPQGNHVAKFVKDPIYMY